MKVERMAMARAAAFALLVWAVAPMRGVAAPRPVLASTTQMQALLDEVGGSRVKAEVLIPGGSCPGHYDLRPDDVRRLSRGAALFTHGFEAVVPRLVAAARPAAPPVYEIDVPGSWLVPSVHARAAKEVCRRLEQMDPAGTPYYRARLKEALAKTSAVEAELKAAFRKHGLLGKPVICSNQLTEFLRWGGMKVVADYGRAEELTPAVLHTLARKGRAAKAALVVDNLQSGPNAGAPLARSLGARRVTISNFPGGFPRTSTWVACVRDNARRLGAAAGSAG